MHPSPAATPFSRRLLLLAALIVALAGACGSNDEPAVQPPGPTASSQNASDVTFAQEMIPHHEQAIVMSDMALVRASSSKVKDLASRIKAAQGPEITKMKGWLASWGQPATAAGGGHGAGGAHGGAHAGMLSDAEIAQLGAASGPQFDRLFLEGMIRHHEGAVKMGEEELDKGASPEAKALARQIIDTQKVEIQEMKDLLGGALQSAPPPAHH